MYGVLVHAHPDLRRILTDYGFNNFPLRKDFPLTGFVELLYSDYIKNVEYREVELTQDFRKMEYSKAWKPTPKVEEEVNTDSGSVEEDATVAAAGEVVEKKDNTGESDEWPEDELDNTEEVVENAEDVVICNDWPEDAVGITEDGTENAEGGVLCEEGLEDKKSC